MAVVGSFMARREATAMPKTRSWLLTALLVFGLHAAAPVGADESSMAPGSGPTYDELYPYYVELCAVSQIKPIHGNEGGVGGHAVLYLKGTCLKQDASYPLIELCDDTLDLSDPDAGVGISVDKTFKNVNWVGVPGRSLLLTGLVSDGEVLTPELEAATVQEVIDRRVFRGIELHEEYLEDRPAGMSVEDYAALQAVGTDYALTYGRTAYCAKLPVTREMLPPVVEFLNALNRKYATQEADYKWSGLHDNCTHTVRNAIAALGAWEPKTVNRIKLLQIFDLAVPANEFVNLAALANDDAPSGPWAVYGDPFKRRTLVEHGWLPRQPGGLIQKIDVHTPNQVYRTDLNMLVLEGQLLLKPKSWKLQRMLGELRYTDLRANLLYFQDQYEELLQDLGPPSVAAIGEGPRDETIRKYRAYVQDQLTKVKSHLRRLRGLRDVLTDEGARYDP